MKYWIFQAVPERYNLLKALQNQKSEHWLVTRYWSQMSKGDIVYFWEAGKNAALHGWGNLLSSDTIIDSSGDNRIVVSYQVQLKPPIPKSQLQSINALKEMQLFRAPQGTNFKVLDDEAKVLNSLIRKAGCKAPPDPVISDGGGG